MMKKTFISLLLLALLAPSFASLMPVAASYDHEDNFTIRDFDTTTVSNGIILYPNDTDKARVLRADDYNFRYSKLMIFNKDGLLIEAGGDLVANADGTFGSCQTFVSIPPRGFMIAFPSSTQKLYACFTTAMEGAMLYNATMSTIYPVYGSYDKTAKTLTIRYNDPETPSKDAPTFLFVGNSTTYFNGTPIKFKAMAAAAGKEIVVEYCTYGSAYLSEFADATHERGKAFRNKLNAKKYDYIVFQDAAAADYYKSKAAMDVLMPLVEANGAQALLYMRYSTGDEGTLRHYGNYPRLSKDFGDLPVANVTGAFNICRELYPDINLLAEDLGHHSCEGSYLIAATWLQVFLGIDPRGNSYTANLPKDTIEALQDCAVKSVEAGLELPAKDTSITIDGEKYELVSQDKKYTSDGAVYSGNWTDADAAGKPLGKRTDGNFAPSGDDAAVGCWSTSTGTTSIVIDLEKTMSLKAFRADLWGNSSWGIPAPDKSVISIEISADGKTFTAVGETTAEDLEQSGSWTGKLFTLILDDEVEARYVKFVYTLNDGNKKFCWSSECAVYGATDGEEPPKDDPDTSDPETSEPDESDPETSEPETSVPEESEESTPETSTPVEESTTDESDEVVESTPAESETETEESAAQTPSAEESTSDDQGGNATLWIILGIVAVIAIAAVVFFVVKKK